MEQLLNGRQDAATENFGEYVQRLVGLAAHHLNKRVHGKVGLDDVVQSAFKSFLLRVAEGKFDLHGPESLWGLLVRITLRKCGKWNRHFRTAKRNLAKEQSLTAGTSGDDFPVAAEEPGPDEPLLLDEILEEALRGLDERERQMVRLKQLGYTVPEIGAQVGRSEFTVYQVLKRVRKRLERQLQPE
jgi:RNA polymerase sigma factor (sigma-70 family)